MERLIPGPIETVFTWISEPAGPHSVVTLTFTPVGNDQTRVTLRHDGFETEAARDDHRGGWMAILDALPASCSRPETSGARGRLVLAGELIEDAH